MLFRSEVVQFLIDHGATVSDEKPKEEKAVVQKEEKEKRQKEQEAEEKVKQNKLEQEIRKLELEQSVRLLRKEEADRDEKNINITFAPTIHNAPTFNNVPGFYNSQETPATYPEKNKSLKGNSAD